MSITKASKASKNINHMLLSSLKSTGLASLFVFVLLACSVVDSNHATQTRKLMIKDAKASPTVPLEKQNILSWQKVEFSQINAWNKDDLIMAWPAFKHNCLAMQKQLIWKKICEDSGLVDVNNQAAIRQFFETRFVAYRLLPESSEYQGLVTGYYEPIVMGTRTKQNSRQDPLYKRPQDLIAIQLSDVYPELASLRLRGRLVNNQMQAYFTRAELNRNQHLQGQELVWIDDPMEAFFLQVQGSGRVYLRDEKKMIRLAYADQNGHPYKSIGKYLIAQGELSIEQASMQGIQAWVRKNPEKMQATLEQNPSVIFFAEQSIQDANVGPKGALGVPLTAERSVAVDPRFIKLGLPIFMSSEEGTTKIQKLVFAQDTGSAILGPLRLDYFWGSGKKAGERAGRMKQAADVWVLLPVGTSAPI